MARPVTRRGHFSIHRRVYNEETAERGLIVILRAVNALCRDRGIFHTKDESLAGANEHRLHIILGESLRSDLASWLKVAELDETQRGEGGFGSTGTAAVSPIA